MPDCPLIFNSRLVLICRSITKCRPFSDYHPILSSPPVALRPPLSTKRPLLIRLSHRLSIFYDCCSTGLFIMSLFKHISLLQCFEPYIKCFSTEVRILLHKGNYENQIRSLISIIFILSSYIHHLYSNLPYFAVLIVFLEPLVRSFPSINAFN